MKHFKKVVFHVDSEGRDRLKGFATEVVKLGFEKYGFDEVELVSGLKILMDVFGVKAIVTEYNDAPMDGKSIVKGIVFPEGDKGE